MRTTLDIEDDVLHAAKEIARHRRSTVGKVVSDLVRESLTKEGPTSAEGSWPVFGAKPDGGIVTLELVNRLRDETP
jgi:hypothetical protein